MLWELSVYPCSWTYHLEILNLILQYIKGSPGKVFFMVAIGLDISKYVDANWAGFLDDHWFLSSYCSLVHGNLVMWKTKWYVGAHKAQNILLWPGYFRICWCKLGWFSWWLLVLAHIFFFFLFFFLFINKRDFIKEKRKHYKGSKATKATKGLQI